MVMRAFADKNGQPRVPLEMVVTDINNKFIQATYDTMRPGMVPPQPGDYVEPVLRTVPAPAPPR